MGGCLHFHRLNYVPKLMPGSRIFRTATSKAEKTEECRAIKFLATSSLAIINWEM